MSSIYPDEINEQFKAVVSESENGLLCLLAGTYSGVHLLFASESGYIVDMVDDNGERLLNTGVLLGSEDVIAQAKRSESQQMAGRDFAFVPVKTEIFSRRRDGSVWQYAKNFGDITVIVVIAASVAEALAELLSVVLENFELPGPGGWELTPTHVAVDVDDLDDDDDDDANYHAYPFPSRN